MSVPPLTHRSPLRGLSSSSSLLSTVLTRKLGTSVWQNRCWWEKQSFPSVWSILMSRWRLPQDQQSLCPQLHPKRLGAQCCSCLVRWLLYEELPECQWWGWTPLCTGNSLTGCSRGLSATRSTKHILILTRKRLFIPEVFSQSAWKQLVSYMAEPKWNLCPSVGLFPPNPFHVQPSRVSKRCYLFYWVQPHPYITCYVGLLLRYNLEMSVEIVYTLKDVSRDPLR